MSPQQKDRLRKLAEEVEVDKITVSFSLEDRDAQGRKMSAFLALSAHRKDIDGVTGPGYSLQDAELMRCILSKHVVMGTYLDAVDRKILPSSPGVRSELKAILNAYDQRMVQILKKGE